MATFNEIWDAIWSIPHIGSYLSVAWIGYLLWLAIWIVLQKREPAATLSWLFGLALLPYVGLLVYYLFGPQRIHRQQRQRARTRCERELAESEPVCDDDFSRLLEGSSGFPQSSATHVQLLVDGGQTYESLIGAISRAQRHVHAEYYIFAADRSGTAVRDALIAAAKRGVQVRLLLDALGSGFGMRAGWFRGLTDAGGEVQWFHRLRLWRLWRKPWLNLRSHRKIVVVDGRIGFTGGVNVTDDENERRRKDAYRDLHLRLEGRIVRSLQQLFIEDWAYTRRLQTRLLEREADLREHDVGPGDVSAQLIASGPDDRWESIHRAWVSAIHGAKRRLWLATPYFVPGEAAMMALTSAALRGVDVRLILPHRSDSLLVTWAARSYFHELAPAGVRIFEYGPRMLHSKAMLVDDDLAIIGSANFDQRSFRLNFEAAVCLRDQSICHELEQVMHSDLESSVEVEPKAWRERSVWQRLPEAFARLMSPLL
ncbi:MAG: cardiolipin synthase [Xanthomonadales bacterium]|nr:cardiolipin synthase [Xanthomonadales bacterium]